MSATTNKTVTATDNMASVGWADAVSAIGAWRVALSDNVASVGWADAVQLPLTKAVSDTGAANWSDTLSGARGTNAQKWQDALTKDLVDSVALDLPKTFTEDLNAWAEALSKQGAWLVQPADSITFSDAYSARAEWSAPKTDSLDNWADAIKAGYGAALSDGGITFTETIAFMEGLRMSVSDDAASMADAHAKALRDPGSLDLEQIYESMSGMTDAFVTFATMSLVVSDGENFLADWVGPGALHTRDAGISLCTDIIDGLTALLIKGMVSERTSVNEALEVMYSERDKH